MYRAHLCVPAVGAAAALAMASGTAFGQATFVGLGDLPGGDVELAVRGVSGDGRVVVGVSHSADGALVGYRAFRWTVKAGLSGLDYFAGHLFSGAHGASGDGAVVAGVAEYIGGEVGPVRWTCPGGLQEMPGFEGGLVDAAFAVSRDGRVIAGRMQNGRAFRWTEAGGYEDLETGLSSAYGVSGDGSVVVGEISGFVAFNAFRWTASTGLQILDDLAGGGFAGAANAVSADGMVTVGFGSSTLGHEACYWVGTGSPVGLGDLAGGAFESTAFAVSADGSVIVGGGASDAGDAAFIWTPADGMRDLKEVLIDLGVTGLADWQLTEATGVSADGTVIVGNGLNPAGQTEGWVANLTGGTAFCYADCDTSTCPGQLDFFDFICFQDEFAFGSSYACDCDQSTGPGACDFFDFICFQDAFAAGCDL